MTNLEHYILTALWSSIDENDEPMDATYTIEDFDPETLEVMAMELNKFIAEAEGLKDEHDMNQEMSHFVHNFWLTRNGHGAGFWDGGYSHGDELSDISQMYGECYLYVGDDGKIYRA